MLCLREENRGITLTVTAVRAYLAAEHDKPAGLQEIYYITDIDMIFLTVIFLKSSNFIPYMEINHFTQPNLLSVLIFLSFTST